MGGNIFFSGRGMGTVHAALQTDSHPTLYVNPHPCSWKQIEPIELGDKDMKVDVWLAGKRKEIHWNRKGQKRVMGRWIWSK